MTICRAAISVTMLYGSAIVIPSMAILLLLPTSHHGHLWSSSQLWWCAGTRKFRVLAQAETCKFGGEALTARKVGNLPFLRCSFATLSWLWSFRPWVNRRLLVELAAVVVVKDTDNTVSRYLGKCLRLSKLQKNKVSSHKPYDRGSSL